MSATGFWLGAAMIANAFTTPHLATDAPPRTLTIEGQQYVDQGLLAAGSLPAGTVDFMGDTLGSFSSLAVAPGSWQKDGEGWSGVLWTLPDRGRNDPEEGLFFDYSNRLHRYRLSVQPGSSDTAGKLQFTPDGGLVLRDFNGQPFTGADPGDHIVQQHGISLPSPASGVGAGKLSLDAESLQFTADGHFYVGDEYTANVYYFDRDGKLQGVLQPPAAVRPMRDGQLNFGSLLAPDTGRRNNQGVEGMGLSPDGKLLFMSLQSALVQDTSKGNAAGRRNTRVLVYDVSQNPVPTTPIGDYVVPLPVFNNDGDGSAPNRTAAQSELRVLDAKRFLLLARDGNGRLGNEGKLPVFKTLQLVDISEASNLAGSEYETGTTSILANRHDTALVEGLVPARSSELLNLLDPAQLARAGLALEADPEHGLVALSEKWEAMDLQPALDPQHPNDWLLLVGNDNDFIARHCKMSGAQCDSPEDNDNRVLAFRLTLP